jgi:hypothetical protein
VPPTRTRLEGAAGQDAGQDGDRGSRRPGRGSRRRRPGLGLGDAARQRGIDVLLIAESKHEFPDELAGGGVLQGGGRRPDSGGTAPAPPVPCRTTAVGIQVGQGLVGTCLRGAAGVVDGGAARPDGAAGAGH